jgi:hypothetical protein
MMFYHYAILRIHELHLPRSLPTLPAQLSTTAEPDMTRFNALHACLMNIKSWLEIMFALPPSAYIGFSFPVYAHMAHCLISLHKLSALTDSAWDRKLARREIDLFAVCDRLQEDLDVVVREYRQGCGEADLFVKCGKALKTFKALWWKDLEGVILKSAADNKGAGDGAVDDPTATTPQDGQNAAQGYVLGMEGFGDVDMSMFNEEWLADMFNQGWMDVPLMGR